MAVQKNKSTRATRGKRRAHHALKLASISVDCVSGKTHKRHHISCDGFYRGKKVMEK
ncbi:50S ribosomal protein L32 [Candidatus Blochmannia ocreatus (nom. nud.)]|uniref:Large ribosomal subunit protein bL32 n=1 Tax=Candidatus Blochmannia ocreatus (nom. nud.) TaxID=251538 RepID=A0ABY4SY53_9ENTR|nr:50S ribosomal protein L32 [Candidatus Blochmannia ocreatus]URJ24912.1 50S ribosomal protein L32 [Candidatus Blochmannia ocreatus]